jgi:hypothetical protein
MLQMKQSLASHRLQFSVRYPHALCSHVAFEGVALLYHIREVSASDLGSDTNCPE